MVTLCSRTEGNGILPKQNYGNINISWEKIAGHPDRRGFLHHERDQRKIYRHANTQETNGILSNIIGEPPMYGGRVRVSF